MGGRAADPPAGDVCEFVDIYVVDFLVIGVARIPRLIGRQVLSTYQNGLIQFYAAVSAASVAILLLILLLLGSDWLASLADWLPST